MTPISSSNQVTELAGGLRVVVNRLAFHLRMPATKHGITATRLSAIAALDKAGPLRPGDLAARLGITAVSMSRLTEALEAGAWVQRSADPDDRRAHLLNLTPTGSAMLEHLRREGTSQLSEDLLALSDDEREALSRALPILTALADRHIDPDQTHEPISHRPKT